MLKKAKLFGEAVATVRRTVPFLLGMGLYNLGVNYVWISYNSLVLPLQVGLLVPQREQGLVVGIIAAVAVTVGVLVNLFSGVLSDNVKLRWGKRRPYILLGTVLCSLSLLLPVFFALTLALAFLSFLLMQTFTNLSSGSYQPLLPDIIQEHQRGEAAGLQGMMTLVGSAMGYGLTGYLVGSGYTSLALIPLSAVFLLTTLVTIGTIRNNDASIFPTSGMRLRETVIEMFRPRTVVRVFFWLVVGSFLIFMGSSGLVYFEVYYFERILNIPNPGDAVAIAGIVILMVSVVSAVVFGFFSDRVGRRNLIIGAAIVAGVATFFVPFVKNFDVFLVVACFVGGPLGVFNSVVFALASDLSPAQETGKYMSYYNLAVGEGGAVAPLFDGVLLYVFGYSSLTGFVALFGLSAVFYIVGAALIFKVPKR
jgi:MFS family permease